MAARDDVTRLQRGPRHRHRAALALGVDQLGRTLDHIGRIAPLDSFDERAVDQAEPEVRSTVPHREGRGFDQEGEGIQRRFGLPQPQAKLGALFFTGAGIDEPQQQAPRLPIGGPNAPAHVEYSWRSLHPDRARQRSRARLSRGDVSGEAGKVIGLDPASARGQFGQGLRRRRKPEVPKQKRVHFNAAIGEDAQRPHGAELNQCRVGPGNVDDPLGLLESSDRH